MASSPAPRVGTPRTSDLDGLAGAIIADRYRLGPMLGHGGMGSVYAAEHIRLGRAFAVKLLRGEHVGHGSMLARFEMEARALGAIRHENVTSVTDCGVTPDGVPFIVMELLDGKNLATLLAEGPLPPSRAVDVIAQACHGVDAAHRAGLIHRDLKPANLLICAASPAGDLVKVVDFGIAKLVGRLALAESLTATGDVMGTPTYQSPEQARGDTHITTATDIYALGLVLYECLSGRRAFSGGSYNEVVYRILNTRPPPLSQLVRDVPAALIEIVERAMAFAPNDRYATAAAMGAALAEVARAGLPENIVSRGAELAETKPPATSTPKAPPPTGGRRKRRNVGGLGAALVAALVLALALTGVAIGLRSSSSSRPTEIPTMPPAPTTTRPSTTTAAARGIPTVPPSGSTVSKTGEPAQTQVPSRPSSPSSDGSPPDARSSSSTPPDRPRPLRRRSPVTSQRSLTPRHGVPESGPPTPALPTPLPLDPSNPYAR